MGIILGSIFTNIPALRLVHTSAYYYACIYVVHKGLLGEVMQLPDSQTTQISTGSYYFLHMLQSCCASYIHARVTQSERSSEGIENSWGKYRALQKELLQVIDMHKHSILYLSLA